MEVSVLIPTYNGARTIKDTLLSVINQTFSPKEIIILVDGSNDCTLEVLSFFKNQISVYVQENRGVANARNRLIQMAKGDILAFIDHDDIWHPKFLEIQIESLRKYKEAVASFTDHIIFKKEEGGYSWSIRTSQKNKIMAELIEPVNFLKRYNKSGIFGSMSYCCFRREALLHLGDDPFGNLRWAEDLLFFHKLPLIGSIIYIPLPLVAYRVHKENYSKNVIEGLESSVKNLEYLKKEYKRQPNRILRRTFNKILASKRRQYAKVLFGLGEVKKAQRQIFYSIKDCLDLLSISKSIGLLIVGSLVNKPQ